jgi:hypothetical protein
MLTNYQYPVYEGQNYIGFVRDGKLISPEGVMVGHINKDQTRKVKKKREELRNLICSRFR